MPKDLNLLYDGGGEGLHVWISINGKAKALVVPLNTLAPGFFTISPGLAAATAFRLNPDGSQTSLQVTDCRNGSCSLTPIELLGGPVYLSFYGTGFTQASTLKSHCEIGGQTVPVLYAGPQLQIAGLDQINLSIPSSLAGSGEVTVSCTFAPSLSDFPRIASNEVRLLFR